MSRSLISSPSSSSSSSSEEDKKKATMVVRLHPGHFQKISANSQNKVCSNVTYLYKKMCVSLRSSVCSCVNIFVILFSFLIHLKWEVDRLHSPWKQTHTSCSYLYRYLHVQVSGKWTGDIHHGNLNKHICGLEISFSSDVPQDIDIKLVPDIQ